MKRKLTLMLALLFVWTGVAWSQGVTVKGVVTSEEDGLPIVGASVLVKGTTQGTITDVDGNFMISGVKADSKTLIVSFVGMKSKEVAKESLPTGYGYELGGMAREEASTSGSSTGIIFILCFVFVYLLQIL